MMPVSGMDIHPTRHRRQDDSLAFNGNGNITYQLASLVESSPSSQPSFGLSTSSTIQPVLEEAWLPSASRFQRGEGWQWRVPRRQSGSAAWKETQAGC